ncbi:MAG: MtnX-like HAD-IB family phosphatase [Nitrospiraceae bacterium]|nr:MtnX-like HAD-IB family phosphatase [Nitrospiraceae bacterium]
MRLNQKTTRRKNLRSRRCATATEVYCDFDGTITCVDATDAVLETFALPAWRDWEQRWVNGEITSQECLSRQVELIRTDRETLIQFAGDLPIDEGIIALDRQCAKEGVPLTIVSDGIDLLVEAVLRRHNLLHLPVYSNHLRWDNAGRPSLSFPFAVQECESGAGTCKCALTLSADSSPSRTVYIGDGRSDQCVSAKMQTLFAKGALRKWCEAQGIACLPFETLAEVAERIFSKEMYIP